MTKVDRFSTVRYDTNSYSVPVKYARKEVSLRVLPERIEIYYSGTAIAVHERCFGRNKSCYSLDHYLPLLKKKGRANLQARPVRNNVPSYFLSWMAKQDLKPKQLVELLECSAVIGYEAVMRSDISQQEIANSNIQDTVGVDDIELSKYDTLYHQGEGVAV